MSQDRLKEAERVDTVLPDITPEPDPLTGLEAAACEGDSARFVALLAGVVWEKLSAEDFVRLIKLALKAGAHLEARHLSERALQQYPDDQEVKKFARVLSPPRVISSSLPPDPDIEANQAWLTAHRGEYSGRWVALRGGQLVGTGASLKELIALVGETRGALLTIAR